jgi:hypothetical protein
MSNDGNAATMRDQDMASEMTIARQRENLERLNVGQLVRRWRSALSNGTWKSGDRALMTMDALSRGMCSSGASAIR